MRAKQRLPDK